MSQEHRSHKLEQTTPRVHPLLEKVTPARTQEHKKRAPKGRYASQVSELIAGSADVFNGFKLYVERANCLAQLQQVIDHVLAVWRSLGIIIVCSSFTLIILQFAQLFLSYLLHVENYKMCSEVCVLLFLYRVPTIF